MLKVFANTIENMLSVFTFSKNLRRLLLHHPPPPSGYASKETTRKTACSASGVAYFICSFVFQGVLSWSSSLMMATSLLHRGLNYFFFCVCLSSLRGM